MGPNKIDVNAANPDAVLPGWERMWSDPPAVYRPAPFWSWNDRLEPEELKKQIYAMRDAGLGGFFMHARGGLRTPFQSEEWLGAVKTAIAAAAETGLRPWLYDENGWPSGFGDGRVNGRGPQFQQKILRFGKIAGKIADIPGLLALFDASGRRIAADEAESLASGDGLSAVWYELNPSYSDVLDSAAVDAFLACGYEFYRERLTGGEWRLLAGFFTDEPQMAFSGVVWDPILPELYRQAYGEELPPLLPELFQPCGNYRRTRFRFWSLVTGRFAENYQKRLFDWCRESGIQITGHHLWEETLHEQIAPNGAAMPHYLYYHIPGIDWLGRDIDSVVAPVQLSSAAAQSGRRRLLSESLGACGWGVNFDAMRRVAQWQLLRGVNFFCWHLSSYSLRGLRKRDYPASFSPQQPWWPLFRSFNDRVARLSLLMAETDPVAEVAIIHPIQSAWLHFDGGAAPRARNRRHMENLTRLSAAFDRAGIGYHYAEAMTMERLDCAVESGFLMIGECRYSTVAVPEIETLSRRQWMLLRDFAAGGGRIMALGGRGENTPVILDGDDAQPVALPEETRFFVTPEELAAAAMAELSIIGAVRPCTPESVRKQWASQLPDIGRCRRRNAADGSGEFFYFVNFNAEETLDFESDLPAAGLRRFDPATGAVMPFAALPVAPGVLRIREMLPPGGELVLGSGPALPSGLPAAVESGRVRRTMILDDAGWTVAEAVANFLPLDYCRLSHDGAPKSELMPVISVQERLMKTGHDLMATLEFTFRAATSLPSATKLAVILEDPERYRIALNRMPIDSHDSRAVIDSSWRQVDLGSHWRYGENTLRLETPYRQSATVRERYRLAGRYEAERNRFYYDSEIETPILYGHFGIGGGHFTALPDAAWRLDGECTLTRPPESLHLSAPECDGLPFFAGMLRLRKTFQWTGAPPETLRLSCRRRHAHAAGVRLNGRDCGFLLYHGDSVELMPYLKPGENILELELVTSLRNLLGPFHSAGGDLAWVGPACFFREPGIFVRQPLPWDDGYVLARTGLEEVMLEWPE